MARMLVDQLFDGLNDIVTWAGDGDYSADRITREFTKLRDQWAKILADDASPFDHISEFMPELEAEGSLDMRITLDVWKEVDREELDEIWAGPDPDRALRLSLYQRVTDWMGDLDYDDRSDMRVDWVPREALGLASQPKRRTQ